MAQDDGVTWVVTQRDCYPGLFVPWDEVTETKDGEVKDFDQDIVHYVVRRNPEFERVQMSIESQGR